MKKIIIKTSVLASFLFLFSCGGGETKETVSTEKGTIENQECIYSYSKENTSVSWLAFKTTQKIGVGGNFLDFTIDGTKESSDPLEVVKGASITIPVNSVETQDEGRNKKIVDFFFGTFTDTKNLEGTVKDIAEDGSGILTLKMNDIEQDIPVQFEVEDANVTVKTVIDINKWNAQSAISKLNEKCKKNHTGEDGVTVVWPEVEIVISSELVKKCD